jgi:hypothetical protein
LNLIEKKIMGGRRKFHSEEELNIFTLHKLCEGYELKEDKLVGMKPAWKD